MRRFLGLVGAALLVAAAAAPAVALEASELEVIDVAGRDVQLLMTLDPTVAIPVNAAVSGTMEIDGRVFPAQTHLDVADTRPRTAVLAIDASGSMAGDRLNSARRAAATFVESVPDDVRVGLISFGDAVEVISAPTDDKSAVLGAINQLEAGGDTTLYDAVIRGLDMAGASDRGRLIVLSDGADTSSRASLAKARRAADQAGIPIDVVGIQPATDQQEILRQFTGISGGTLLAARGASDLVDAFTEASKAFGVQVGLSGTVPEDIEASGRPITATVSVDGRVSEKSTRLPAVASLSASQAPAAPSLPPAAAAVGQPSLASSLLPIIPALVVFAAVLVIGLMVARQRATAESAARVRQVLRYRTGSGGHATAVLEDEADPTALSWLEERLQPLSWTAKTRRQLEATETHLTPASWLVIRLAITLVSIVVLAVLLQSFLMGVLVGGILGWFGTWAWLRSRAESRQKAFAEQLPDFLMLLASSLRAGLSFTHALDSSARDGKGEVYRQMRRVLREVQVGAELDDALMSCAERMNNTDLKWAVTALSIQREVGGSLSEILDGAARTIKERYEIQREVRTLSAEGRLSAYILIALPIGVFLFLLVIRREYVSLLWTDPWGVIMLVVLVALMAAGIAWMRAVVKIKV